MVLGNLGKKIDSLKAGRLLISALFFVAAFFFLKNTIQYLPSLITVNVGEWTTGSFSIYVDTGKGFSESESYQQNYTTSAGNQSALYFLLPRKNIKRLRIDPGSHKGRISIKGMCLHGFSGTRCWPPKSLEKDFFPSHDISRFKFNEGLLDIHVSGNDPHFSIKEELGFEKNWVSWILKFVIIIVSITLAVIVFYLVPIFYSPRESFARVVAWCRQYKFDITLYQLSAITILFSLLASGLWLELDQLGQGFNLGLLIFLVFLALKRLDPSMVFEFSPCFWRKPSGLNLNSMVSGIFFGMIVIMPIVVYLGLTWHQEFPYIGDNQYHRSAFISSHHFWNDYSSFAVIFIFTGLVAALAKQLRVWIPIAFVFLIASSYFGSSPSAFLRYPGIGRIFGNMLLWVTIDHSQWDSFFNILRTSNALAVIVWISILRPLIIKRWPGIGILPFAFLFFYQPEVVDYFTSAYLEPWALVFVLLGVELIIVDKTVRSQCVAYMLVGMAALIKEQMIFVLPFVWLASQPWKASELIVKIVCGFAAIIPFLTYYLIRRDAEVSRGFFIATYEHIFNLERLSVFGDRVQFHFGLSGILLILSLIGLYAYLYLKQPNRRFTILALAGALLFQLIFFYIDGGSINYTGYPRFLLAAYLLLSIPALMLPDLFRGRNAKMKTLAVASGIFMLQGIMLVPYGMLSLKPSPARNFSQHYDQPLYLPIADLIGQAENRGVLLPKQTIYVADPTGWDISSIKSDYSKLGRKYKFKTGQEYICQCVAENSTVIASFIYFGNLNRQYSQEFSELSSYTSAAFQKFYLRWWQVNKRRPQCIKDVMATCRYHFKTTVDDEIVGIMGVGVK